MYNVGNEELSYPLKYFKHEITENSNTVYPFLKDFYAKYSEIKEYSIIQSGKSTKLLKITINEYESYTILKFIGEDFIRKIDSRTDYILDQSDTHFVFLEYGENNTKYIWEFKFK